MTYIVSENGHFRNYENHDAQYKSLGGNHAYLLTMQDGVADWIESGFPSFDNNKSVAGYSRTSCKAAGVGYSYLYQPQALDSFCERMGLNVVHFKDPARSGRLWNQRKDFQRMKRAVFAGQVAHILVCTPDRLTREQNDLNDIAKWPCNVWALYLNNPTENHRRQTEYRKANDYQSSRVPIGKTLNQRTQKLEYDARDFQVYRDIQELRARRHTWKEISKRLNWAKITTKEGKPWSESNVKKFAARLETSFPEIMVWQNAGANDCTNGPRPFAGTSEAP